MDLRGYSQSEFSGMDSLGSPSLGASHVGLPFLEARHPLVVDLGGGQILAVNQKSTPVKADAPVATGTTI